MKRPPTIGLVHGGGQGVYEQSGRALQLLQHVGALVVFIAVNEAGISLPELQHWGSLHPNKFGLWIQHRGDLGHPMEFVRWSVGRTQRVDRVIRTWKGGSSGLHGADIALNGLGLDGVILCGVPMDSSPNQFRGRPWHQAGVFRAAWQAPDTLPTLKARVRSMAGWTQQLLGLPSPAWLDGLPGVSPVAAAGVGSGA